MNRTAVLQNSTQGWIILCLVFSIVSCSSDQTANKAVLQVDTSQKASSPPVLEQGIDEKKKSIVVLPCANGYDFATYGMELEAVIANTLDRCGNFEAEKLSLKNISGVNVYGLWHEKDLDQIRTKITSDYFVVCRMNASSPEPSGGEVEKDFGYRFRIYESKTGAMKGEISSGALSSFDSIPSDIARRCDHIRSFLDL